MNANILIVDDDLAMCELLESGLRRRGFDVVSRTSGDDAARLLASEDFDVVVTDLNMRGMNGVELCKQIADKRPDLPVVLITAFGSLETAVSAIRAGACDFVTKPFALEDLVGALERALTHRKGTRPVVAVPEGAADGSPNAGDGHHAGPGLLSIEEVERRYILGALEALGGNRTQTARTLGLDRKTLYRKLRRYGFATDKKDDDEDESAS